MVHRCSGSATPIGVFDVQRYSGSRGELDSDVRLADGTTIEDREIANRFPTTYVLDRHGVVVFSHIGPIPDWSQCADFLNDLAAHAPC